MNIIEKSLSIYLDIKFTDLSSFKKVDETSENRVNK